MRVLGDTSNACFTRLLTGGRETPLKFPTGDGIYELGVPCANNPIRAYSRSDKEAIRCKMLMG